MDLKATELDLQTITDLPEQRNSITVPADSTFNLIRSLLDAFHASGINYCHWKSSEHLPASMVGDTDLDVLFDAAQESEVTSIVLQLGFKKFVAPSWRNYAGIVDFIGLDIFSGKIVHLHAHFQLTLGEAFLKGYQLKFTRQILAARLFDTEFDLYRIAPEHELVLLFIRLSLKTTNRDVIRFQLGKKPELSANILREYEWLKERCTPNAIAAALADFGLNTPSLQPITTQPLSRSTIIVLRGPVRNALQQYRLFSPLKSNLLRWYREGTTILRRKYARFFSSAKPAKRTNPNGGIVVALIGADGSGKSTVIANLQASFRKKIDTCVVYMGKGSAGGQSRPRKFLNNLKKIFSAKKNKKRPRPEGAIVNAAPKEPKKLSVGFFNSLEALIVAAEKKRKLRMAAQARNKGMLVICDRFPQIQQWGYNDGPALQQFRMSSNPLLRLLASREARAYYKAAANPPDLVVKLVGAPELLKQRKPDSADLPVIARKVAGIRSLKFAPSCTVITIDVATPLEEVLRIVKEQIWKEWN